jgi:hypothetical protein
VDKVKGDEANFKAHSEIQKNEIEDLRKQLAEAKLKCVVAKADRDASGYWKNYFEKTVAGLRASKQRCFEKSVVGVSDPRGPQPDRLVNFSVACPCPDGLMQDGTQAKG